MDNQANKPSAAYNKPLNLKKLYPEYANHNLQLALAYFNIEEDIKNKTLYQDVSILQRKGNVTETIFAE